VNKKRPTCLDIGLFLLCIYYSHWKHTSIFIYSSWQVRPTCLEIGFFLLCIYYSPSKHTLIFIYNSWQVSLEHFSLSICDFQKTFLSTQVEATEVSILATSAWSEMNGNSNGNWRYGKTREFRVKSNLAPKKDECSTGTLM
jgi:hypothetical protein